MIGKLKRKFIALSMSALLVLLCVILLGMNIINFTSIVAEADQILELLRINRGDFPDMDHPGGNNPPDFFSPEAPFENRYFSILITSSGDVLQTDMDRIEAVDAGDAIRLVDGVSSRGKVRGFLGRYRYLVCSEGNRFRIIFLDLGRKLDSFQTFLISSIFMSLVGYGVFFWVIVHFSGKMIQPVVEAHEKQKQFITNAGHELKTPLTIIKADTDVLEMEFGENEWIEDIQNQARRLTDLTNDLVFLSRMEESGCSMPIIEFPFSDVVAEAAASFQMLAQTQGKEFTCTISPMISMNGNEKAIRHLVGVLLDNAVKYSPCGGRISLTADRQGAQPRLIVCNSTSAPIPEENLDRIFERFYRMDSSRSTSSGGYGIGLSIASAITHAHRGKILASMPQPCTMQITVLFPIS